jgi:hypothetical protein
MLHHRPDGKLSQGVPDYRRVMPYLMRRRNESVFFAEQSIDMTRTERFIAAHNGAHPHMTITPFHIVLWASVQTLDRFPRLNRFVAGGRLYDRDGIWISCSAKKELVDGSPLVVIKRRFDPSEPFDEMVAALKLMIAGSRGEKDGYTDRELALVLKLQGLPLRGLMGIERFADAFGLLPRAYIERDPLFASMFIANLGSLGMDAGFHHLYEYGSVSLFCTIGSIQRLDGSKPSLALRFSYDERIEDGMYAHEGLEHLKSLVEDPASFIGVDTPRKIALPA